MNSTLQLTQHEPFLRSLPRDITLREIARRAKKEQRYQARQENEVCMTVRHESDVVDRKPRQEVVLCVSCIRHIRRAGYDDAAQIWSCLECGQARGWGNWAPDNPELRPVLTCKGCDCFTRHGFVGVIGRTL